MGDETDLRPLPKQCAARAVTSIGLFVFMGENAPATGAQRSLDIVVLIAAFVTASAVTHLKGNDVPCKFS